MIYNDLTELIGNTPMMRLDALAKSEGAKAVSYTHLDVYKRQVIRSVNSLSESQLF